MKIKFDKKMGADALAALAHGTAQLGQKAAAGVKVGVDGMKVGVDAVKSGVDAAVEKAKSDSAERKLKKLNPLFPDKYFSEEFALPNIVVIVDDAVRRDIELCEGAIGWIETTKTGVEVLRLYDEFVPECGLQFIPAPICDTTYCVDNFDRTRFVQVNCVFDEAHKERMAELKRVAYCLGAKRCSVEISEVKKETQKKKKVNEASVKYKGASGSERMEQSVMSSSSSQRAGRIEMDLGGHDHPTRPALKWFAHESTVQELISMRCEGGNAMKAETLEIFGSACATMSQKTAGAIDAVLAGMGKSSGKVSFDSMVEQETQSKLVFRIEF